MTATEAAALGIRAAEAWFSQAANNTSRRFLAVVTRNFSTTGASFRKDQQILLESIQDYGKRGTTVVNGEPVLLWLDNIKDPSGNIPRRSFPGRRQGGVGPLRHSRRSKLTASPEWFSRSLHRTPRGATKSLSPTLYSRLRRARKLNRAASVVTDPVTGQGAVRTPNRVLTVTYTLNGLTKTKQAIAGQPLVLD